MVNAKKLYADLAKAGIPVVCVRSDGDPVADYNRELTVSEQAIADGIIAAHDPVEIPLPTVEERISAMEEVMLAQLLGG